MAAMDAIEIADGEHCAFGFAGTSRQPVTTSILVSI